MNQNYSNNSKKNYLEDKDKDRGEYGQQKNVDQDQIYGRNKSANANAMVQNHVFNSQKHKSSKAAYFIGQDSNKFNIPHVPAEKHELNFENNLSLVEQQSDEIQSLQEQLARYKSQTHDKDIKLEETLQEVEELTEKNYEQFEQITELEVEVAQQKKQIAQMNKNNLNGIEERKKSNIDEEDKESRDEEIDDLKKQVRLQKEERLRDREMMMQVMMRQLMSNTRQQVIVQSVEDDEEAMLQRAIEESKRDMPADPNNPNVDDMTYEEILELEQRNGKVSKGLKKHEINKIREKIWRKPTDTFNKEKQCSICFDDFKLNNKIKELPQCHHSYHSKCINQWLENESRCPVCNDQL